MASWWEGRRRPLPLGSSGDDDSSNRGRGGLLLGLFTAALHPLINVNTASLITQMGYLRVVVVWNNVELRREKLYLV